MKQSALIMPNLTQLRLAAREIFDEALRAVDAGNAVRRAVRLDETRLEICDTTIDLGIDRPIYSIAVGKAALPMGFALEDVLGEQFTAGLIIGSFAGQSQLSPAGELKCNLTSRWRWHEGPHPLPTNSSLLAAADSFDLLKRANEEHALIIFLISGGGSAMIEWPINEDITLANLRIANKALVSSGASIIETNAVRRSFSAVKGGGLAARAPNCDQITLIVSDVPAGEESSVASGPTLPPPLDAPDAREVIARYNLRSQLPETILRAIDDKSDRPLSSDSGLLGKHFVLIDNNIALEAAAESARQRGFATSIAGDITDQPIETGCAALLEEMENLSRTAGSEDSVCLISGGEFACPVRGEGIGGRNLETALRLALSNRLLEGESWVALCAGTDGIDGNSPAAGAIVDSTTIERARATGLPEDFLKRSDAYSFFVALGDVLATGPTGTNVRDMRILIQTRSQ